MPVPKNGENRNSFINRCLPHVMREGKTQEQALGMCYGLFREHRKKTTKKSTGEDCHCGGTCGVCSTDDPPPSVEIKAYTYKLYDTSQGEVDGLVSLNSDPNDITTDDGEMSAMGILCTSRKDWVGDVVNVAGVDTSEHQLNPIVLYDHGKWSPFPIGLNESPTGEYTVYKDPDREIISQKTFFHGKTSFSTQCYILVKERIIRANSIAFKDLKVHKLPPEPDKGLLKPGRYIETCALVETTWCPAGMNPDAVLSYLTGKKIDNRPLDGIIRKSLEQFGLHLNRPVSVSVPGSTAPEVGAVENGITYKSAQEVFAESSPVQDAGRMITAVQDIVRKAVTVTQPQEWQAVTQKALGAIADELKSLKSASTQQGILRVELATAPKKRKQRRVHMKFNRNPDTGLIESADREEVFEDDNQGDS